jgi:hypothetical protein
MGNRQKFEQHAGRSSTGGTQGGDWERENRFQEAPNPGGREFGGGRGQREHSGQRQFGSGEYGGQRQFGSGLEYGGQRQFGGQEYGDSYGPSRENLQPRMPEGAFGRPDQSSTQGWDYGNPSYSSSSNSQFGRLGGQGMIGGSQGKQPFRGPKGYTRSDERIREDVCDTIGRLGEVDPSEVEVTVREGEVTLAGTVEHRHWKHTIEDAVDGISGVREVTNNIRVKAARRADESTRTESKEGDRNANLGMGNRRPLASDKHS